VARSKGSSGRKRTSGKATHKSAVTGRYVTAKHGKVSPEAKMFSRRFNKKYRSMLRDLSER
jgi:hypothetical protein